MNLSDLHNNDVAIITKVKGRGAFRKRITEMGFVKGKEITVIKPAPLRDPVEFRIMGYEISLRRSEAALIEVVKKESIQNLKPAESNGIIKNELFEKTAAAKGKLVNIALVGNPNSGKTSLFNYAAGASEHVGNYSGVTVDAKKGTFKHKDYIFNLFDLPGTYSLTAYSPEELYVRKHITDTFPDIIINVIDASNIERNLFLTTQLIDMDVKVILALNMYDELQESGAKFDYIDFGKMLGTPVVPTVASKGKGIKELFDKAIEVFEDQEPTMRHIHISYGKSVNNAVSEIQEKIKNPENYWLTDKISSRFLAIKLLENDKDACKTVKNCKNYNEINRIAKQWSVKLQRNLRESTENLITDARYGFINGALKETFTEGRAERHKKTEIIDTFITHKVFGFPIFIFFMWVMFQSTFTIGSYPMDWIDRLVQLVGNTMREIIPAGAFKDLLIDGVIGGVGGVIVFLPNILILFFFISLMEDTGYMARAAFIMDKLMHKIGLHGKSFIPLVMGFGCNVPAIMATRTLENRSDRLLTMLINPFMSCSARLPVYILIVGAFFPDNSGSMLFLIYSLGIALAAGVAYVFSQLIFKTKEAPFVMELPPYRLPTMNSTLRHMWHKGREYLKKMGGIILIASILIWALGYYPQNKAELAKFDKAIEKLDKNYKEKSEQLIVNEKDKYNNLFVETEIKRAKLQQQKASFQQEHSYIGLIGQTMEPVFRPLGFDWKMGVSIITGIAAKEIVISTMAVLYQAEDDADENSESLRSKLQQQVHPSGKKKGQVVFTPLVAFGFLIFTLIYFPCIAVIAAVKRESGSWKWAAFMIFYTTGLAWLFSFLIYQIGSFFNL